MKTENFIKIINSITGRDFKVKQGIEEIGLESEYYIYRVLPVSKRTVGFIFKTPKKEETLIKTFITQFTSKYFEPDPASYDGSYYGSTSWDNMSEEDKEFAYLHHRSNMFNKKQLLEQVKENAITSETEYVFSRYGFYATNYGVGLFVLFGLNNRTAVSKMKNYLDDLHLPYHNEFSDARWVFRFVLNISKEIHIKLLNEFNKIK